jgi:hypothetical protein
MNNTGVDYLCGAHLCNKTLGIISRVFMSYQIEINVNNKLVKTLADILPETGPIKLLIIGKTPAPIEGHLLRTFCPHEVWRFHRAVDRVMVNRLSHQGGAELKSRGYAVIR